MTHAEYNARHEHECCICGGPVRLRLPNFPPYCGFDCLVSDVRSAEQMGGGSSPEYKAGLWLASLTREQRAQLAEQLAVETRKAS